MYYRVSIGDYYVDSDMLIYDSTDKTRILFMSIIGHQSIINNINPLIRQTTNVSYYSSSLRFFEKKHYNIYKYKDERTGLVREFIMYKNFDQTNEGDNISLYLFYKEESQLKDILYKNLDEFTTVPLVEEWKDYLYNVLKDSRIRAVYRRYNSDYYGNRPPLNCSKLNIKISELYEIISNGLKSGMISVNGSNEQSEKIQTITGLDSYLAEYSEILADKIKMAFSPRFVPGEDEFSQKLLDFDDVCYEEGTSLYYAQKCAMQSTVNTFKEKSSAFIIGEQGSGKTIMSLGTCYATAKKDGFNAFIMCPAHLVNKWQREAEKYVPNGKAYIVKNVTDIQAIDHILRDKKKTENSFVIFSKENAKLDSEYRPNVLWSSIKHAYVCPKCGIAVEKPNPNNKNVSKYYKRFDPVDYSDFTKPGRYTYACQHCGTNFWTLASNNNDGWIKLGSDGWFHSKRMDHTFEMLANKGSRSKQENSVLAALSTYRRDPTSFVQPNYIRYPLAKYIHKRYKSFVDFAIGDELHLYNGDSAQGEAFGLLASVADKTLGLTGTLLNGYADGLFYTLFRTMPDLLKEEGFEYTNKDAFNRTFGVVKNAYNYTQSNYNGTFTSKMTSKKLPGVSPLVFTKFLLENAVFISLTDMLDGLPNYSEYPIGIPMDEDLNDKYRSLEQEFTSRYGRHGMYKLLGSMTKTLSAYPDMPYGFDPIIHPDENKLLFTPQSVDNTAMIRPKEQELINIVKRHHNNNEKVLVYYHWTNIIELDMRLVSLLEAEGLNVAVLKSSVSAQKREEWIKDKVENSNIDVLLCNPSLVETGLDLLYFTTIIFYEVGYNLYTMRQASRRSWRLGQTRPISVYYLYYYDTIQEQALSLMATKLQASMAIEGKFNEEGLQALSDNEDMLTKIANNIVSGIKNKVNDSCFKQIDTTIYHQNVEDKFEDDTFDLFDSIISSMDGHVNVSTTDFGDEDNAVIQHIITEKPRILRKTRYQVEGKKYVHNYWSKKTENNILNFINSRSNVYDICV